MNYQKIYSQLIERAKIRNYKKLKKEDKNYIYLETHHILPRSLGGKDTKENLVNLTAREHFLAHLLYEKISKDIYGKNSIQHNAMITALNLMASENKNGIRISSRTYSYVKQQFAEVQRKRMSGSNNPMYGRSIKEFMTEEQIDNWHQKHQGKNHQFYGKKRPQHSKQMSGSNNPMYGRSVKEFMTDEEIQKWRSSLSEANRGEKNGFFGKHHSDETKEKMRNSQREYKQKHGHGPTFGKKISKEASQHLSKIRKGKKKTKEQLIRFNKTRIEKHFSSKYDLSEFDYESYVCMSLGEKVKYRKTYFKTHLKIQFT